MVSSANTVKTNVTTVIGKRLARYTAGETRWLVACRRVAIEENLPFQPLGELGIGEGQDLRRQHGRVCSAVDGDGRHRSAFGRLNHRYQGIEAAERPGGYRDAYDGQVGAGCDGAREVGRHAGGADYHLEAAFAGGAGVLGDGLGVRVDVPYLDLVGDTVVLQARGAAVEDGEVGLGAYEDADRGVQKSSSSMASRAMSVR